jgi:hypothetical protein
LGISIVTLDRLVAAKRLAHFRIGSRIIFSRLHLDSFLKLCERPARPNREVRHAA